MACMSAAEQTQNSAILVRHSFLNSHQNWLAPSQWQATLTVATARGQNSPALLQSRAKVNSLTTSSESMDCSQRMLQMWTPIHGLLTSGAPLIWSGLHLTSALSTYKTHIRVCSPTSLTTPSFPGRCPLVPSATHLSHPVSLRRIGRHGVTWRFLYWMQLSSCLLLTPPL